MTPSYDDAYGGGLEGDGAVYDGITWALLLVIVTAWACIWSTIWLLSGVYVALHLGEDQRPDVPALGLYKDDL
jgi:hypothetical protein